MPIYEYGCRACGRRFAWLTGVVAGVGKPRCPGCGGRRLRRLVSRFATARGTDSLDDLPGALGAEFGDDLSDESGGEEDED